MTPPLITFSFIFDHVNVGVGICAKHWFSRRGSRHPSSQRSPKALDARSSEAGDWNLDIAYMLTWVALKSTWDDIGTALVALALRIDGINTTHFARSHIGC